jgi:hypothetical protein
MRVNPATGIVSLDIGVAIDGKTGIMDYGLAQVMRWGARQLVPVFSRRPEDAERAYGYEVLAARIAKTTRDQIEVAQARTLDPMEPNYLHLTLGELPLARDALKYYRNTVAHSDGVFAADPSALRIEDSAILITHLAKVRGV